MTDAYLDAVMSVYQGEVLGESMFSGLLATAAPEHQHYFAAMLQMETEAKAMLRPVVMRHGMSIVESEVWRQEGYGHAARLGALPWSQFLRVFNDEILVYVDRYQGFANQAPAEDRAAMQAMVEHEKSFVRFAQAALADRPAQALAALTDQLVVKLPVQHIT